MDSTFDTSIDLNNQVMEQSDLEAVRLTLRQAATTAYKKGEPGRASMNSVMGNLSLILNKLVSSILQELLKDVDKEEQDEARLAMDMQKMNLSAAEQSARNLHADADVHDRVDEEELAHVPSKPSQAHHGIEKQAEAEEEEQFQNQPQKPANYAQPNIVEKSEKLAQDAGRAISTNETSKNPKAYHQHAEDFIRPSTVIPGRGSALIKYPPVPNKPSNPFRQMEVIKEQKQEEGRFESAGTSLSPNKLSLSSKSKEQESRFHQPSTIKKNQVIDRPQPTQSENMWELSPIHDKNEESQNSFSQSGFKIEEGALYISPNSSSSSPDSFKYNQQLLSHEGPNPLNQLKEKRFRRKKNESVNPIQSEERLVSSQSNLQLRGNSFRQDQERSQEEIHIKQELQSFSSLAGHNQQSLLNYSNTVVLSNSAVPRQSQEAIAHDQHSLLGPLAEEEVEAVKDQAQPEIAQPESRPKRDPTNLTSRSTKGLAEKLFRSTGWTKKMEEASNQNLNKDREQ